jgi:bifunctional UDP-N-acetylglucosamine pyrophosphorylase/glucosamine-1-phosphate N-acetyltransferase
MNNTGVIILAAGEGKRMGSKNVNKVALTLNGKPMIRYVVEKLARMGISPLVIVVGFAKESVEESLKDLPVTFIQQKEQLGTGNAVLCGLAGLYPETSDVLVIQGDDSAFYSDEVLKNILTRHVQSNAAITFLTIEMENPNGLGRVVRENGKVTSVVEDKDATKEQLTILEVNPACYVFRVEFLKQYSKEIKKSPVTGEYYLTSLIEVALQNGENVETLQAGKIPWRGINTIGELEEAEKIMTI